MAEPFVAAEPAPASKSASPFFVNATSACRWSSVAALPVIVRSGRATGRYAGARTRATAGVAPCLPRCGGKSIVMPRMPVEGRMQV